MFSVREKVGWVLWLAELKSYNCVFHAISVVFPRKTAPMNRRVMRWVKRLKERGELSCGNMGTTSLLPTCSCLCGQSVPWSSRSPDLTLDFYFWGLGKGIVYRKKKCRMCMSCVTIVRTAECLSNEVLANTWGEI